MRTLRIAALGVMLSGPLYAQGPDLPARLSLDDALRIAETRNPQVEVARQSVVAAEADVAGARKRPNPAFTFSSEGLNLQQNRPAFWNNQEVTLAFEQEIETGGRRALRTEQAVRGAESFRAAAQDGLRLLRLEVRCAYMRAVLAKADDAVARTTLDEIDKVLAVNRSRYEQGELSGVELRRLQVERFRFADDVFASELALRNARSALLALLNVQPLDQPFDTVDGLPSTPMAPAAAPPGSAQATATALATRPDVVAALRDRDRARANLALQRALSTPSIAVGAGVRRDFGANGLFVNVGIPVPIFNRNEAGVARAAAEERQAAARLAAAQAEVSLEVQEALNALDVSRRRVMYAEGDYLKNAVEARDIVLASYRSGAATLIDYLDAERSLREALRVRNRSRFEYQISLFQYEAAVAAPGVAPGKDQQ